MIVYDFKCKACGFCYSLKLKFSEMIPKKCPSCQIDKLPRITGKALARNMKKSLSCSFAEHNSPSDTGEFKHV